MASLNVKTEYSEYKDCKLRVGKYVEDNSVAVEIYNRWDGPIARVTTCLCDHSLAEDEAYVDRDELRFTDGFHDMRMTQARMEAFIPGGDAVLADVYRRVRGTRSWHPVVKELKKLLDERGGKAV